MPTLTLYIILITPILYAILCEPPYKMPQESLTPKEYNVQGYVYEPPQGYSEATHCVAMNLYFESRGEGYVGMRLVAHNTLNRVGSSKYPDDVCSVVYEPPRNPERPLACQYSWTCDTTIDLATHDVKKYDLALEIANDMLLNGLHEFDLTFGALLYTRCDYQQRTTWARDLKVLVKHKNHCFY